MTTGGNADLGVRNAELRRELPLKSECRVGICNFCTNHTMTRLRWNLRNLLAITTLVACFMGVVTSLELSLSSSILLAVVIVQQLTLHFEYRIPRLMLNTILVATLLLAIWAIGS